MKTCSICHIQKPLHEFYVDANRNDGRKGHCKGCHNARYRKKTAKRRCAVCKNWFLGTGQTCSEACKKVSHRTPTQPREFLCPWAAGLVKPDRVPGSGHVSEYLRECDSVAGF